MQSASLESHPLQPPAGSSPFHARIVRDVVCSFAPIRILSAGGKGTVLESNMRRSGRVSKPHLMQAHFLVIFVVYVSRTLALIIGNKGRPYVIPEEMEVSIGRGSGCNTTQLT
jgi:hypothetical protein